MENQTIHQEVPEKKHYPLAFRLYVKEDKNVYEIKKVLMTRGLSETSAKKVADDIEHMVDVEIKGKSNTLLYRGDGLFVFGCLMTLFSYADAVNRGGGTFLFTYGMIIAGISYFIRSRLHLNKLQASGTERRIPFIAFKK